MRLLKVYSSAAGTVILAVIAIPYLTASAPTNTTSATDKQVLAISPVNLAADQCPTPPTEFLPYPPPQGYSPGPGCAPASQGTQPSENNPPPGFYGGSGSGSGSGSSYQATSPASSMRDRNLLTRVLGRFLSRREKGRAIALFCEGTTVSVAGSQQMDGFLDRIGISHWTVEDRLG
ncbi:hypothetical protein ACLMJK_000262 [Lecanora helva]